MWQLRLIIVLIGVVFIALVYLLSRQRRQCRTEPVRAEPSLDESPLPTAPEASRISGTDPVPTVHSPAVAPEGRRLILSLHVLCLESAGFDGAQVLAALQTTGLHPGQYQVFHRFSKSLPQSSVFSVASLVEPGVLIAENLPQQRLPGLTLFLVLPGPQDGVAACADMLATARALARQLGGMLQDEHRQPLTPESAQHIRQRILDFQQPPAPSD